MIEKLPETQCSPSELTAIEDIEYSTYVFNSLEKLQVTLDADPLRWGPARLSEKIYKCTDALSQCERIFADLIRKKLECSRNLTIANSQLKLDKDNLFATDPEVRAGRNVSDREALANTKLVEQIKKIQNFELTLQNLEALLVVVVAKRKDLLGVKSALRQQHQLCQEEIGGVGRKWGRSLDTGSKPKVEEDDEDENEDNEMSKAIDEMLDPVNKLDPVVVQKVITNEDVGVDALLDSLPEEESKPPLVDDDLSQLFD